MAIIVDKEQKKRDIALACKDLIISEGMMEPTISTIAQTAGIGKGTFYEYFSSKEELLFELVTILMGRYNENLEQRLKGAKYTKEKVKIFAEFFYAPQSKELRILYKMFTAITLLDSRKEMKAFQTECFDIYYKWFEAILQEGIENKEIIPSAIHLSKGIFATAKGLFIAHETTNNSINLQEELSIYIDTIFDLIKEKR